MPELKQDFVDYQEASKRYRPGDSVHLFGRPDLCGVIIAVHEPIGMLDIRFPEEDKRLRVEEVQLQACLNNGDSPTAAKVASEYTRQKKALYWANKGRKYRATMNEMKQGTYHCPRCRRVELRPTTYKLQTKLFSCPNCTFTIRKDDMIGLSGEQTPCCEEMTEDTRVRDQMPE